MNAPHKQPFQLIAIHGFKQSGKDTVADYISQEYGFVKKAFATKVKQAINVIYDVPLELLNGSDEDKNTLTDVRWDSFVGIERDEKQDEIFLSVRELMQIFATEMCRDKQPNIWFEVAFKNVGKIVVSDLRFNNEAEFIKQHKGFVIGVRRQSAVGGNHQSESGIDSSYVDVWIDNDSNLEELYANVSLVLEQHDLI